MTLFSLGGRNYTLRYLSAADAEKYRTFFEGLSDEALRCRFGGLHGKLAEATIRQRVDGNKPTEKALAILDDRESEILAVGRCILDPHAKNAEIALVVADNMRRHGLGRFLLDRLLRIARNENCRSACAYIATQNAPVIKLLESAGFRRQPTADGSDAKLMLAL